ncbi:MAG: NfeD family protein [Planctomycetales bacterium]|nr:NfeD family protein [Planctomycetales bacterium]
MSQYYWPAILLFATIALAALELVIPSGGVLGIMASLTYVASIVAAYTSWGFQFGTIYLVCTMVVAVVCGNAFVRYWPKTAIGRRIFGTPPSEEEVIPERRRELHALVGARGKTISAMLPSGAIRIDGRVLDAVSDGMVIEKDTPIEIVRVKANHLVVKPVDPTNGPQTAEEVETALQQPIDPAIEDPFRD